MRIQNLIKGFSLIEILVALAVLSLGIIGALKLQLISKQANFEAFQQTQASFLAHDIVNRIKINSTQLENYQGEYSSDLSRPSSLCDSLESACSPEQMQEADKYFWAQALIGAYEQNEINYIGGLSDAFACITVDNNQVSVAIHWRGSRSVSEANNDSVCSVSNSNLGNGSKHRFYHLQVNI